tara:strand:+ start:540 stop:710 length:171 start_codon:yes stop_codon:yes gene_type:complete
MKLLSKNKKSQIKLLEEPDDNKSVAYKVKCLKTDMQWHYDRIKYIERKIKEILDNA